jgi:hypothetical protein
MKFQAWLDFNFIAVSDQALTADNFLRYARAESGHSV